MLLHSMHARLGGQTAVQSTPLHLSGKTATGTHILDNAGTYTAHMLSHSRPGVRGRRVVPLQQKGHVYIPQPHTPRWKKHIQATAVVSSTDAVEGVARRSILYTWMMPRDQDRGDPFLLPRLDDSGYRKLAHFRTCYMDALGPQRTCPPFPAQQNCIKLGKEGLLNLRILTSLPEHFGLQDICGDTRSLPRPLVLNFSFVTRHSQRS